MNLSHIAFNALDSKTESIFGKNPSKFMATCALGLSLASSLSFADNERERERESNSRNIIIANILDSKESKMRGNLSLCDNESCDKHNKISKNEVSTNSTKTQNKILRLAQYDNVDSKSLDSANTDSTNTDSTNPIESKSTDSTQRYNKLKQDKKYDNLEAKQLEKVVVTAGGFEQDYTLAPASISTVSPKEVMSRPVRDLGEAIQYVPGVSIDSGISKSSGYNISIRGSTDVLTLIDGNRVNSGGNSLFPNGYGSAVNYFIPPMSAIERIEVIRGPASTLYGSDAMGGVVNIITKKNFDKWGASLQLNTTLQEEKRFGHQQGFSFYTAGPLNSAKNWGLTLRGSQYARFGVPLKNLMLPHQSNNTAQASTLVGIAPGQMYNIGGRLQWNSLALTGNSPRDSVYVDLDYGAQLFDNSDGLLLSNWSQNWRPGNDTNNLRRLNGYDPDYNIFRTNAILSHSGSYVYRPDSIFTSLKVDNSLSYNRMSNDGRTVPFSTSTPNGNLGTAQNPLQQTFNGVTAGDDRDLIAQDIIFDHKDRMLFSFGSWGGLNLSVGGRYWYNTFNDKLLAVVAQGASSLKDQHIGAIFAEGELMLFDRVFLTLGGRGNFNSLFGANFSPRAYISYKFQNGVAIKGGVSTGYKTPALNNLVNGVVSFSASGQQPTYGNPKLTPETSVSYEVSMLSENDYLNASMTLFYTDFKDRITSVGGFAIGSVVGTTGQICSAQGNYSCSYYTNLGEAKSYGAEIYLGLKPISVGYGEISANAAYTYNHTYISRTAQGATGSTDQRLTNIPLHSVNAGINYDSKYFGAYIRQEVKTHLYRGNPNTPNTAAATLGEYYKPILLTHLGFYGNPTEHLRITFAIYNLLNRNFVDYQQYQSNANGTMSWANNYNYIREGRRYYLSLTYDF
ncbi:TonB-dependent receptor domain-containing protein [Helicobacter sp. T3_23-1056]